MKIIWSNRFTDDIKYYSKKDDNRIPTDGQIFMMIKNIIEG